MVCDIQQNMRDDANKHREDQSKREFTFAFDFFFVNVKKSAYQSGINSNREYYGKECSEGSCTQKAVQDHSVGNLRPK